MKLDRNINKDGRGKYALINLRTNQIQWGGENGDQFFVMKYRDRFTAPALKAYAGAITREVNKLKRKIAKVGPGKLIGAEASIPRLEEFAADIYAEAEKAKQYGCAYPS